MLIFFYVRTDGSGVFTIVMYQECNYNRRMTGVVFVFDFDFDFKVLRF